MKALKFLFIASAVLVMAGCNLEIMVPKGGNVTSLLGAHNCAESTNCVIEITDATFSETFTAEPKPGYVFSKWMGGGEFLCGDSTDPVCNVSNTLLAGDARFEPAISSYATFFIMPVFKNVGFDSDGDGVRDELDEDDDNDGLLDVDDPCPLNPDLACGGDTITANGKEWFQPDLFTGLSWSSINTVCPNGVCNGILNGYNMNEWTWASSAEVQSLFESYGPLPVVTDFYNCTVVDTFFNVDGWRKTNSVLYSSGSNVGTFDLVGWTSTPSTHAFIVNMEDIPCSYGTVDLSQFSGISFGPVGAWFYLTP